MQAATIFDDIVVHEHCHGNQSDKQALLKYSENRLFPMRNR